MEVVLAGVFFVAAGYQLVAILAALAFLARPKRAPARFPGVSVLKPTIPGDPGDAAAIESHRRMTYAGPFEILVSPEAGAETPNRKVGKLMLLAARARYDIWVLNDSDIRVERDYLDRVVAPLEDPKAGLVTALFRASSDTPAGRAECIWIAVGFMPSLLVARVVGVREYGVGATLAFRKADLERAGGLPTLADYVADDYMLAKRITELGLRTELAATVVETTLGGAWAEVWRHQVRWARTIRVSRADGYAGIPVTHAGLWALLLCAAGAPGLAAVLAALRVGMAWVTGVAVLRCPLARRWFWVAPLLDVAAFAVWVAGLAGNTVFWQSRVMELNSEGRILPAPPTTERPAGRR
jgi:ceramide glucosyltransferase